MLCCVLFIYHGLERGGMIHDGMGWDGMEWGVVLWVGWDGIGQERL